MTDLRYPIGGFEYPERADFPDVERAIATIERLPAAMRAAVGDLSAEQLDTPYRPGGWTVRQVIHHVVDSHLNAYVRTKLALTEDDPEIRPYDEKLWAELPDSAGTPVEVSLTMLDALHRRWVVLLRSCSASDFERPFRHPEIGSLRLGPLILQYAWHGDHHLAHVTSLREREGW